MTDPISAVPKTVAIYSCGEVIGDGLYKLAFVEECRRRFPGAKITWIAGLGSTAYAGALKPLVTGWLDEVIENPGIGQLASSWIRDRRWGGGVSI